jgi:hypothetical protein
MSARRPLIVNTATGRKQELPSGDVLAQDGWLYVKVTADFSVTAATFADILQTAGGAALGFTPAANTDYEVEGILSLQTATATIGPRHGLTWGTGYLYGSAELRRSTTATAELLAFATIDTVAGTCQLATGGVLTAAKSWNGKISAMFRSGTTPTAFKAQIASATAGTSVTVKAGSFIRYRIIG